MYPYASIVAVYLTPFISATVEVEIAAKVLGEDAETQIMPLVAVPVKTFASARLVAQGPTVLQVLDRRCSY